jgi:CubicO group peptidase (beta-lactamase class C family)
MTTRKKVGRRKAATTRKKPARPSKAVPPLPAGATNLKINPAQLRDHDMRPAHVTTVSTDRELQHDAGPVSEQLKRGVARKERALKHLDVNGFGDALHAALKNDVVGYIMRLKKNGSTIYTLQWNWAQTPTDNSIPWNPDKRMHVASVSKLITAIAMTRLLDNKNISYDAKIINYLPTYWIKGPNVNKITFRHLLTNTSGFVTANGETDYMTMKVMVMLGVFNRVGTYDYENMNFGLCRILISIINGNVNKNAILADNAWDLLTITGYMLYVANKVFAPAGVTNATLDHPNGSALAYNVPTVSAGWNSGNLMTVSGGAGWHISVNDLLKVMGTFRRKGTIMSTTKAQKLLDNGFGVDVVQNTPAGMLYNKNGLWQNGSGPLARVEQSLAYFLPEDMELVVLANSPVGIPAKFFRSVVSDIYLANLK